MIVANPIAALLPALQAPAGATSAPRAAERDHDALAAAVARLEMLARVLEWHEETLTASATAIPHQLARVPWGFVLAYQDAARIVYADKTLWTDREVYLQASGTVNVRFGLF